MPELPEIEHLKRTLQPWILGCRVVAVDLKRPDIVRNGRDLNGSMGAALLAGQRIERLARHGKQLAIIGSAGTVVSIHLGMSGQLRFVPEGTNVWSSDHIHCIWRMGSSSCRGQLVFRDPRRFGGIWPFRSLADLDRCRWSRLGPDALSIRTRTLATQLAHRDRSIKSALLDQCIIAGVGNIYADEALFLAGIHPVSAAGDLDQAGVRRLANAIRNVMKRSIRAGGSSLRDFSDASGTPGWFKVKHNVYGRGGLPCRQCRAELAQTTIAQRTTVFCPSCQRLELSTTQN